MTGQPRDREPTHTVGGGAARTVPAIGQAVSQRRYGGPEVLKLVREPVPAPAAGQVLVRVRAASVNARDWHVMRGEPRVARLLDTSAFGQRAPRTPVRGTDLAGVVAAVGPGVTRWAVGDAVFGEGTGTFAEYAVAAADRVAGLPAGVSFEEAAAIPLGASTALLCVEEAGAAQCGTVLINGASGGVGTFAIQIAKALGWGVTAVVSPRNLDLAGSLGADEVVDYAVADFTRTGQSYDAVVDLVGNRSLRELRRTVRPGGTLVLSGGGTSGEGRVVGPMRLLIGATAVAQFQPFQIRVPQAQPTTRTLERVKRLVESGAVRPVIDRVFPLDDVPAAIRYLEVEHARAKVVITVP